MNRYQRLKAVITERQISSLLFFLISVIVVTLMIITISTYMHESVHQAINLQFGMKSEFGWKFEFPVIKVYTRAIIPDGYTFAELCDYACSALHMENEILSYNLEGITELLISMFVIYVLYQHKRNFDEDLFFKHLAKCEKQYEYAAILKQQKLID